VKGELIHENVLRNPEGLRLKLVKADIVIARSWLKGVVCSFSPRVDTIHLLSIKTTFVFLQDAEVGLFYSVIICHRRVPASVWRRRMGSGKVLRQLDMLHRNGLSRQNDLRSCYKGFWHVTPLNVDGGT